MCMQVLCCCCCVHTCVRAIMLCFCCCCCVCVCAVYMSTMLFVSQCVLSGVAIPRKAGERGLYPATLKLTRLLATKAGTNIDFNN